MTHEDIFHRAVRDIIHSKNSGMLDVAHNYSVLFVRKCLDDGVKPAQVNSWRKLINIAYQGTKKQFL